MAAQPQRATRNAQRATTTARLGKKGPTPPTERTPEVDAGKELTAARRAGGVFTGPLMRRAAAESFRKLDPRAVAKNPVMFVVEVGAVITTIVMLQQIATRSGDVGFTFQISLWLWFTVVFANFAEAMAEARGKAQADTLRATKRETPARRLRNGHEEMVPSSALRKGDIIVVREGEIIPSDGEVIDGVAYVNEAAITGESAPVIKEPGTDIHSSVTGGTQLVSDTLRIKISADPGHTFLDRMIELVEGAVRHKTPNELALSILLAGLSIIFLLAVATLEPFAIFAGTQVSTVILIALLVCLIPTTIGGLLSAIGIAGMDRVTRFNVLAMSGRAVEAAGDIDVLLLDKTGTITHGNRLAAEILPVGGATRLDALITARQSSLGDTTPEGRSILSLAEETDPAAIFTDGITPETEIIPFSAETRMSGVRIDGHAYFKGAPDAMLAAAAINGSRPPDLDVQLDRISRPADGGTTSASNGLPARQLETEVDRISRAGGTPLALLMDSRIVGVVYLKDTVKPGMRQRFEEFRRMGIRTVMVTGDNPLTAATIAAEAGVDDFVAQAKPEEKIRLIREEQAAGHLVAMTGDGTNDAPALAQADVGMAMNSGTAAAKEAANMVDLDSNPTKLIEVVAIGKQLLITRGAITTFSVANDVAKYFAIIPAAFAVAYPELGALNVMQLTTPQSAILSAVIFNAVIIIALVPLALRGVGYRPAPASELLARNLLIWGVGGILSPFVFIKLIDIVISTLHLA